MSASIYTNETVQDPCFSTANEAFAHHVQQSPDRMALEYFGKEFTYAELGVLVAAAQSAFRDQGLQRGDRVIVQLQNVPQFVISLLAGWRIGLVFVPVSPMYTSREVNKLALDAGARAIIMAPHLWNKQGPESLKGTNVSTVFVTAMEDMAGDIPAVLERSAERVETLLRRDGFEVIDLKPLFDVAEDALGNVVGSIAASECAILAYTSGTTGPAKGAMVTHANLADAAFGFGIMNDVLHESDKLVCIAPLVHITGIGVNMTTWLLGGGSMVMGYRFHPKLVLDALYDSQATWIVGAATAYLALLDLAERESRKYPSLRVAASGGAAVPQTALGRFRSTFGVNLNPGFGMTETSGSISSTPLSAGPRSAGENNIPSVGLVHPGISVSIRDEDGGIVEKGERGEIWIRGGCIVEGYWNNPEASSQAFTDGWLRTGDVGFMDDDHWLYLVDRTKNLIVASGYKVWPREVEEVISGFDEVLETAVIGVPDKYRGETVKAFIAVRAGRQLSEEMVRDRCKKELAAYKVPTHIEFISELPKNQNGKILHRKLKSQVSS